MPVPTDISQLSTTPGSNSPSGADSPSVLDDHQRTAYAFIRTLSDAKAAIADTVQLTGNQTIAGVKTFSSTIAGSITGNAATATNLSSTLAIAGGGTGATTAAAAFTALKQAASDTVTGVVEKLTVAEAQAGLDDTRYHSAATMKAAQIIAGTSVVASGTAIDFTGLPVWVKRVTVILNGISTNSTSFPVVRLGTSAGIQANGYAGGAAGATVARNESAGFAISADHGTGSTYFGILTIVNVGANAWIASGAMGRGDAANAYSTGGGVGLAGTLDRIRLTTLTGTDTFDAGSINVFWE